MLYSCHTDLYCAQLFGYDQGVLGAVIGLPSFRAEFNNPSRDLESIIAAIYDIDCFLGAILAFLTADRFGRKGSVMWGRYIMVIGTILQVSATESVQMLISRIITDIGNGVNTVNVPIWQAESFKSHNRSVCMSGSIYIQPLSLTHDRPFQSSSPWVIHLALSWA